MDWSDEYFVDLGEWCPFGPNIMECDEHLCVSTLYSCGDGECIEWRTRIAFQRLSPAEKDCFNKRNLNYMCEVSPHQRAWTLDSGLCWPDKDYDDPRYSRWDMINTSNLTDEEKCQYVFRCALSKGFEHDCPCNHLNCSQMIMSSCSNPEHILYPPYGLIDPNFRIFYNYSHSMEYPSVQLFGGLKCRGYFFQATLPVPLPISFRLIVDFRITQKLCTINDHEFGYRDFLSSHKNDISCWNGSLTFSGRPYAVNPDICNRSGECISRYRIRDGSWDCYDEQDEEPVFNKNYCTENAERHRFQCFNDEHKCLPLLSLGGTFADCSNSYDNSWYGTGTDIRLQHPCFKEINTDCHVIREYIQQSSTRNSSNNSSLVKPQQLGSKDRMPFRHYCDSFWNLEKHLDEIPSSCQYWMCHKDQYQCQTGQCIELSWVCDGEWDCSDASDEEAILLIEKWSSHNSHFSNLPSYVEKCRQSYFKSSFSNYCNTSYEFGCYRSQVSNPLDIELNRPCINLTQIGDDVEDCYNAYDEKNTFTSISKFGGMWGFHFRCGNDHIIYPDACDPTVRYNCSNILCSSYRDKDKSCSNNNDFICPEDNFCKQKARCDGNFDCVNGEDEYWCSYGTIENQIRYRGEKKFILLQQRAEPDSQIYYPYEDMLKINQHQLSKSIINLPNDESFKVHSYQCNRGIAVVEINKTRCLCPPAYYGDWCQFFNDRISIIAHVDKKTELETISNGTLKIKANLIFNNRIIDHHEFHVVPTFKTTQIIKYKFYLLYSRSKKMLTHKQRRYTNRSDVINNHPYSVHFDIYALEKNNIIEELGSWRYPIYFDYLPAFRLAVVLKFPSDLENATLDSCWENSCNENSTCRSILNQNNSYYCSCNNGYYGTNCNQYEPLCKTYCSANALCRLEHYDLQATNNKPYCICPLGHFGPRCNLKYEDCDSNSCLNNGTCFPSYDPSSENPHQCRCSEGICSY
jgi:hypothetical protein